MYHLYTSTYPPPAGQPPGYFNFWVFGGQIPFPQFNKAVQMPHPKIVSKRYSLEYVNLICSSSYFDVSIYCRAPIDNSKILLVAFYWRDYPV